MPGINTFFNIERRPGLSLAVQSVALGLVACAAITVGVAWRRRRVHANGPASREPAAVKALR